MTFDLPLVYAPRIRVRTPIIAYEDLQAMGAYPDLPEMPADIFPVYATLSAQGPDHAKLLRTDIDGKLLVNSGGGGGGVSPVAFSTAEVSDTVQTGITTYSDPFGVPVTTIYGFTASMFAWPPSAIINDAVYNLVIMLSGGAGGTNWPIVTMATTSRSISSTNYQGHANVNAMFPVPFDAATFFGGAANLDIKTIGQSNNFSINTTFRVEIFYT